MRKLIIGSREFERRKLSECRENGITPVIRREFETLIKAVDGEQRALDFTISTGSVDRYGDTVSVDGWRLENYRSNPVVLWMHDNQMLPVGRGVNVRVEDGSLQARVEFTPAGMARFNDTVFEMLKAGFLSATSVGFAPVKYNFVDDPKRGFGVDFIEQELLEFSIVTVPANAEALIEGRAGKPVDDGSDLRALAAAEAAPEVSATEAYSLDLAQRRVQLLKLRAA